MTLLILLQDFVWLLGWGNWLISVPTQGNSSKETNRHICMLKMVLYIWLQCWSCQTHYVHYTRGLHGSSAFKLCG